MQCSGCVASELSRFHLHVLSKFCTEQTQWGANLQRVSVQTLLRQREEAAAHVRHGVGDRPADCGLPPVVQQHLRQVPAEASSLVSPVISLSLRRPL